MDNVQLEHNRHSLSHLLAAAVLELFPDAKPTLGPAIDTGFYYDFEFPAPVSEEDLPRIEAKMLEILPTWKGFEHREVPPEKARELFKGNPYKLELIEEIVSRDEKVTLYTSGKFTDLCRGGHANNPSKDIAKGSFKLDKLAGAYWRGDEKNAMLTRIYGFAFASKKELDDYLAMMEEAKKRDHRRLGRELDLFHIDDVVGLGLPLWHPKGALLWRIIEDFWYKKHMENGYSLVRTPHIGNRSLWETSGHWGFYNKTMYPPIEVGQTLEERQHGNKVEHSEEYLLKPMNCPFHVQIYKNDIRSYRDLPYRWGECGTVYRFEKKGELSGLTRVRGFTQDDAHIICRKDQVENELKKVIDFILFMYRAFGFDISSVNVYLSLHDPQNKEKYAGNEEEWAFTENVMRKVAQECGLKFKEEVGEAAFYGPKLDFKIKDVLGREWQCSTLQFDSNLPERFSMSFINNEGQEERPIMLHRALFGSFERFIGLLIEHYGGAFPLWLSPIQLMVHPISEKHAEAVSKISAQLNEAGLRVETSSGNETIGKRIREAEKMKVPYSVILGDKDIEAGVISVRKRGSEDLGQLKLEDFMQHLAEELEQKA